MSGDPIIDLQERIAHLERHIELLDEVVRDLHAAFDRQQRDMQRLAAMRSGPNVQARDDASADSSPA